MKTVEDLRKLREKMQAQNTIRRENQIQIIVGMGTCGIAAGAREVMTAILDAIQSRDLEVTVKQTGCIGMCEQEVLVDVVRPGQPRVTYGRVKPDMVKTIIEQHVQKGEIVENWAIAKLE